MQIFVAGTWSEKKAATFADKGFFVGQQIANRGYDLACGPGTGVSRYVIDGYRSVSSRGKVRFYLPSYEEMQKVGEDVGVGADEIIETGLDYPLRNIFQVKASDALFIITGGDGTLEEAIVALADYNLPVGAVKDSGTAVRALQALLEIFPSWKEMLLIHDNITSVLDFIDLKLSRSRVTQEPELILSPR